MIDSKFLIQDRDGLLALEIAVAVEIDQDRSHAILDHPAAAANRHWSIARWLAFDTSLTAAQCLEILSKLK